MPIGIKRLDKPHDRVQPAKEKELMRIGLIVVERQQD